jgi:hypothetical protein
MQNYIRVASSEDEQLIKAYFKQAYNHYEAAGELLAMQDIKYFLENMNIMRFYVKEESTLQITYVFEMPGMDGSEQQYGELSIPFQNN